MPAETIPLFPLNTVLFPQGILQLRIFEPRYLDMLGACTRQRSGFGVVLIRSGSETGPPPSIEEVGTLAMVQDFEQRPDGLLGITALGTQRFRLQASAVRDDGLMLGEAEWIEEMPGIRVPQRYRALADLLRHTLEQITGSDTGADFEDAAWVGYRLAEMLPVQLPIKQRLLEVDDPLERLAELQRIIEGLRVV